MFLSEGSLLSVFLSLNTITIIHDLAFTKLTADTYVPIPVALSADNNAQERLDANAAFALALRWYVSGNVSALNAAIRILDAWSSTLVNHTGSGSPLQCGWSGPSFAKAAEIIRYTSTAWPTASIARFEQMLYSAFVPFLWNSWNSNGNWEHSIADSLVSIGVFTNNRTLFNQGLGYFCRRLPMTSYLTSDGPTPVPLVDTYYKGYPTGGSGYPNTLAGYWYNQTVMVDGLGQETCRDIGHVIMGLCSATYVAETAYIQGIRLWDHYQDRFLAGTRTTTLTLALT